MSSSEWVDIPTFNGKYQVNEFGYVRSVSYKQTGKSAILKSRLIRGYLKVDLYKDSRRITLGNHQAVAMAFLGHNLSNPKITVNHKDHNVLNNHKENLEIISLRKNSSLKKNKGDRLIGTYKRKGGGFTAKIYNNSKRFTLGHFNTEEEASDAYLTALDDINNGREINEYHPNMSSKCKGVHYSKDKDRWISNLTINGKTIYIGSYKVEQLAIDAITKSREEFLLYGKVLNKSMDRISKRKGVTYDKRLNKWSVRFCGIFIGNYKTEEEGILVSEKCERATSEGITAKEFKLTLKKPKPQKVTKKNSSEVKGITYKSTKNIWECYHYEQGKKLYVGSFKSEADAINALNKYKKNQ